MSETPDSVGRTPLPPELSPRAQHAGGATFLATPPASGVRRLGRALSWVLALTSLMVLLGSGGAWLYVKSQFSNIKSIGALCLQDCKDQPTELGQTENFLLVGTDTRSGANSTGANAGLAENGAGVGATYGNSDTTMLVHLSADHSKVIAISFPRDMLVTVPTYTDSTGKQLGGYPAKFNAAFSLGGPRLLAKQVEELTGLPVDHYLSIDFSGFQSMVDALGGVTICLSQDAYDPGGDGSGGSGFKMSAGVHKLNGIQALQYVRQRHGLPGGDLDRIQRQQRFLSAIVRAAKQPSVLLNPLKLNSFVSAIVKNVSKDSGTSISDLLGLVTKLKGLSTSSVEFNTVPTLGGEQTQALGAYLPIDSAKAKVLFQDIHDDVDPANPPKPKASATPKVTASPKSTAKVTVAPSDISLVVANGSGINGKGAATSAELQAQGYHVTSVTTQTRSDPTSTVISYGSDRAGSAQTLAAAIPGAVLSPDSVDGTEALTLIIGTDFTSVQPVTVGGAAPSTPSAAPTTAAAPTASPTPSLAKPLLASDDNCGP